MDAIFKKECVFTVKDNDLSRFIKEKLGREVELVATEEWHNDSQHLYSGIDGEFKWDWDKRDLDKFLNGGAVERGMARLLLNHLCAIGQIEPGDYLITVSW